MGLRELAEAINTISDDAAVEVAKTKGMEYGNAVAFFTKGKLPDSSSWDKPLNFGFEYSNDPYISRESIKDTEKGKQYTARVRFAPGINGGAGISIDPVASNYFLNIVGVDSKIIRDTGKAFSEVVRKKSRSLNDSLAKWLKEKESFLYHIVGFENRDKYKIDDVMFKSIRYGDPMIDPTRRKWPASKMEIWIPVTADIVVNLKETRGNK